MPRLVSCNRCHILQRMPDVTKGTPMVPAKLEWRDGERYEYRDDTGLPVMVPAFDPLLEDFVIKHDHGVHDNVVIHGQLIQVWTVDQKTWDSLDVVTRVKTELEQQFHTHYAERDEYREEALKCFGRHGNPDITTGCRDYLADDRRIGPATYEGENGQTISVPPKFRHYLCHLCPFQQAAVTVELRRRKGMYNEDKVLKTRAKRRKQYGLN